MAHKRTTTPIIVEGLERAQVTIVIAHNRIEKSISFKYFDTS